MTPQSDEDEVWRQIVASFNETAEPTAGAQPWPDRENVGADDTLQAVKAEVPAEVAEDAEAGRGEPAAAEDDDGDHFIPPPPPPLPKMDPGTKIAWVALFGGPAYLLLAALLSWPMDGWIVFAAIAAFIGGFVALIVRMGDGPPPGSGWDDGAVI
ncbi:hypothetical protein Sme01_00760 [Sphaerisporangium melleum]|uniref:DUF308 domain-containing protein n=1 Tax=Sphaerisporangium melleum TaxID=321316 RepID=A0A917RIR2_9ACTN|nr:hypothetical protein [Sphaerisporangium melleum]GGL09784.1 hypothetical protein GCM10007964_59980 [Sphaerisporangium melleum]GII67600.1 hypothetical protein Sme01_00760 [Sphaerisporangium melleum]